MVQSAALSGIIPAPGAALRGDNPGILSVSATLPAGRRPPGPSSRAQLPLLLLLILLCHGAAAAEVYKWKDADGHVHFGDRPSGPEAESVTIRSGPAAAANEHSSERLRQVLDGFTKDRQARDASRVAAQAAADKRELACTRAKERQRSAQRANFLFEYTPKGERRVLEGDEYQRVIDKARQAVADSCD